MCVHGHMSVHKLMEVCVCVCVCVCTRTCLCTCSWKFVLTVFGFVALCWVMCTNTKKQHIKEYIIPVIINNPLTHSSSINYPLAPLMSSTMVNYSYTMELTLIVKSRVCFSPFSPSTKLKFSWNLTFWSPYIYKLNLNINFSGYEEHFWQQLS